MPYYTPLRYPGGKRRLAPVVTRLLKENGLSNIEYAEPYAGGAALTLLFGEHASTVHINDLSRPVFAFWHCVLEETADLCKRIEKVRLSMAEWHRQRAVYDDREQASLSALGFATLFLNRTNRSGIVSGGVIGGKQQTGEWGLDARFTKPELIQRIRKIARYRTRIKLYQMDALKFTNTVVAGLGQRAFVFFDPPYIEKSEDLYLNTYDLGGHQRLARRIATLKQPWVVTYDSAAIDANLYPTHRRLIYGLNYSAQDRYQGREVMFFADHVTVPSDWRTAARIRMSAEDSRYPLFGRLQPGRASTSTRGTRGNVGRRRR